MDNQTLIPDQTSQSDQNQPAFDQSFLKAASGNRWTKSPTHKGVYYKHGKPYVDVDWQGKVIRYCITETLLERCLRLRKDVSKGADGKLVFPDDEMQLCFKVVERLANLKGRG
jgi:hypothetical protein